MRQSVYIIAQYSFPLTFSSLSKIVYVAVCRGSMLAIPMTLAVWLPAGNTIIILLLFVVHAQNFLYKKIYDEYSVNFWRHWTCLHSEVEIRFFFSVLSTFLLTLFFSLCCLVNCTNENEAMPKMYNMVWFFFFFGMNEMKWHKTVACGEYRLLFVYLLKQIVVQSQIAEQAKTMQKSL